MNERKYLKELILTIQGISSERELEIFLEGILTPKELIEIPTRLQIVRMLKKGIPQHKIAQELAVGIATVTRGSKEVAQGKFNGV